MKTLNTSTELKKELVPNYRPRIPKFQLNDAQKWQYDLLLKGLGVLPENEIKKMPYEEKRKVIYRQDLTWKIINRLKQERMNSILAFVINKLVPDITGNMVPFLIEPITDSNFMVLPSLKEANVTTEQIVKALIKNKILPQTFLN